MQNWQEKLDILKKNKLAIRVEKDDEILYESQASRLKPLFECLVIHGEKMQDAVVIDKVIGRAAAMLCVVAQVKCVITPLASETAKEMLEENNIPLYAETMIPTILNNDKTDLCPMEKMSLNAATPQDFFKHLKTIIKLDS